MLLDIDRPISIKFDTIYNIFLFVILRPRQFIKRKLLMTGRALHKVEPAIDI